MNKQLEMLHTPATKAVPGAQPLLFIHGAYSSASCWQQHFMPWFAAHGHDCHALSLEGHGNSEGQDYLSAISIDDYVANLKQVIGQHFARPPIVIAHSMGGFVLQQYLAYHSLPGAVLLSSVPPSGLTNASLRLMTQTPALFIQLNRFQQGQYDPDLNGLRHLLFSRHADLAAVNWVAHHSQVESARAIMDMNMVSPWLQRAIAPLPCLVLGAEEDQLIATTDIEETARLFGCGYQILPGMGHMMMLDKDWEQCAGRILAWLRQTAI